MNIDEPHILAQKLADKADKLSREGKWSASVAEWDKVIPMLVDGNIKAMAYSNRGNAKNNMGDHEGAIADLDRALKMNPGFAEAYNNRGNTKVNMGDNAGAITDYSQAIKFNSRFTTAYSNRGGAKNNIGDYKGAVADLDHALEIDPQYADAYVNRGNAKHGMGDYKGAIADHDRAIEINPRAGVYNNRGHVKHSMGDYEGAIADYNQALEINPKFVSAYTNRGATKDSMGDYEGAIADYNQALEIDSKLADAYINRGTAKNSMGDHEGAIADYNQALEINPKLADAYNNRGAVKDKMGDYEGAIADYDQALKINPTYENAIHNRGVALAMQASQKGREEIEAKYQAQLQAQQEKFASELREQSQAQINRLAGGARIIYSNEYVDTLGDYDNSARWRGALVWIFSFLLGLAAIFIYGYIACFGMEEWEAAQSPMAMRVFSPLSLFPFILMGTLVLSPLAWVIRMLNRDKHKYWVLREDARSNRDLLRIIETGGSEREDLWRQLFDHYDKRGSAHLIADWNHSDGGGGNNFTINPGGGN